MSYTNLVKEEILHKNIDDVTEKKYELYAILKSKDAIHSDRIDFKTENVILAKRVYSYLREFKEVKILVKYSTSKSFGEHKIYSVFIPFQKNFRNVIEFFTKIDNSKIYKNKKKLSGYIRGIFLTKGYLKNPEKEYAIDFFIENSKIADFLYKILKKNNKKIFITEKQNKHLVYIRNSEDILDILILIGAVNSFFKYEEVTVLKEIKNKTVRAINWEVANETKIINTGNKQLKMIEYIEKNDHSNMMTSVLWEVAEVRKDNIEASLSEIAEIIGISKSGVRNRFRRIKQIYEVLLEKKDRFRSLNQ